jgi:ribosomal-protein-alanine N-acetyltransferase
LIRRVRLDDLTEVMRIERSCFPVAWEYSIFLNICLQNGEVKSGESKTLFMDVIENRGSVAGYIVWEVDIARKEGHILNLAIRHDERRIGKGRRLLSHVLDHLRSIQVNTCFLEVRESNFPARNLYESYGFIESDKIPRYYFDEDAIIYSIDL